VESGHAAERVELIDEESVVDHGTRRVTWFVRVGDTWQRCGSVAGAKSEQLSAGPGTVWQTRVELELPRGTAVMRRILSPTAPRPRDAFSYLTRQGSTHSQKISHTYYKVRSRGTLQAVEAHGMHDPPVTDDGSRPRSPGSKLRKR
jgi:hypothetical protein